MGLELWCYRMQVSDILKRIYIYANLHFVALAAGISIRPPINDVIVILGTAVAQWLRCCATNRKVAGSTPAGATGIFH